MRHGPPDVIWKEILCSVGLNFSVSLSTSSMSLSLPISNSEKDSQELASKEVRTIANKIMFFIIHPLFLLAATVLFDVVRLGDFAAFGGKCQDEADCPSFSGRAGGNGCFVVMKSWFLI